MRKRQETHGKKGMNYSFENDFIITCPVHTKVLIIIALLPSQITRVTLEGNKEEKNQIISLRLKGETKKPSPAAEMKVLLLLRIF